MYFDTYYLILVMPAILLSLWASWRVKGTFAKYSKVATRGGLTGAAAARQILDTNGLQNVAIETIAGELTDHFDPQANVIRLSEKVHSAATVAAVGVAAHEAGHAVQYAIGYNPIKLRAAIIPITQIGSSLSMPLVFIGLIASIPFLTNLGILLFATVVIFQLVTLPVEFNASSRAVAALSGGGYIEGEEEKGVKAVLSAAALTYVAALITAVANLLRLILLANNNRRR